MSPKFCFICSQNCQLAGAGSSLIANHQNSRNLTSAAATTTGETLYQLLQLPQNDNTLIFGTKFRETFYCSTCVNNLEKIRALLNELAEIQRKIEGERILVETQLKESCEIRRSIESDEDEGENGADSLLESVDQFREQVIKEIQAHRGQIFQPKPPRKKPTKKSPSRKKPRTKDNESKKSAAIIAERRRVSKRQSIVNRKPHSEDDRIDSDDEIEFSESLPREVDLDCDRCETPEPKPIIEEFLDLNVQNDTVSVAFVEVETPNQSHPAKSGPVDETGACPSDAEEIFVEWTVDGRFKCPYAPECKTTFQESDSDQFVTHIRVVHNGKVPMAGAGAAPKPTVNAKKTSTVEINENKKQAQALSQFSCKKCCESFESIERLKNHQIDEHEDDEWAPTGSYKKKLPKLGKKPKAQAQTERKRKRKETKDSNSERSKKNPTDFPESIYKCCFCDVSYKSQLGLAKHVKKHVGKNV